MNTYLKFIFYNYFLLYRKSLLRRDNKMIIGISTDANRVSPHFGRAPEFTLVRIENNKLVEKRIIPNPGHSIGSIPQFMNDNKVNCMITGGMGHRAKEFFNQFKIEVITGVEGEVDTVIGKILKGEIKSLEGEDFCNPSAAKGYGVEKIHDENEEHDHHHHN
jgi:predicted Fe-Mo cluster-binding NifX family protein